MGLLDDAIREHLELKRKHGASDEEISQKEAEALGPARRGFPVQQAEPAEAADAPAVAEAPAEPEETPGGPFDAAADPLEPPAFEPAAEEPTAVEPPRYESPAVEEPPPVSDDPAPPEPEPEPTDEHLTAEEEPGEDEPKGDDDVLEETPEFLQDAPEHDRLWFEQKPPRDFDFD